MTEKHEPLRATLKAGRDFDAPWLTVDASTPEEMVDRLSAVVAAGVSEALVNAANTLKAVNNAAPIAADIVSPPPLPPIPRAEVPQQPAQQGGWNTSSDPAPTWAAGQQQAPAAPQQQPRQQSKFAGPPHPEGKTCDICPNVLEFKKTSSGKGTWRCPDWRWNSGNPNGHSSVFAD